MSRQISLSRPAPGQPVRLAFEASYLDVSLRLVDLSAPLSNGAFTVVRPLADATLSDFPGRFSPDGKRVAFASARTGDSLMSLWTVGVDDDQLRHLKAAGGEEVRLGSWSPDGREIAFDAAEKSNLDIYLIREDGANRRRLTTTASADWQPWWSRNGQWIYFTSDRTGRYEVWRMGVNGADQRQITHNGGFEPMESPDGRFLYYLENAQTGTGLSKLMRTSIDGGNPELVFDGVRQRLWQITQKGILFVTLSGPNLNVNLFRVDDRTQVSLGILPFPLGGGGEFARIAASSDGRWLLTTTRERDDCDLMLIDNFR